MNEEIENRILNESENERLLNSCIEVYYEYKQKLDFYKKEADKGNAEIKALFEQLNTTEYETNTGLVAKLNIQKRESFDEDKLLAKIKDLKIENIIKTKEYVDMDALENAIYQGNINAAELSPCRIIKEIPTLKVTKKK